MAQWMIDFDKLLYAFEKNIYSAIVLSLTQARTHTHTHTHTHKKEANVIEYVGQTHILSDFFLLPLSIT